MAAQTASTAFVSPYIYTHLELFLSVRCFAAQGDQWCNVKLPLCQFVNSIWSSLSLSRNRVSIKRLILNKTEKNLTNNILIILLTFSAYSGDISSAELNRSLSQFFFFFFFWTKSKIMISEPQLTCVGSNQCHHKPLQTLRTVPVQRALWYFCTCAHWWSSQQEQFSKTQSFPWICLHAAGSWGLNHQLVKHLLPLLIHIWVVTARTEVVWPPKEPLHCPA